MATTLEDPVSMMCCAAHFNEPHFERWMQRMRNPEPRFHRKYWEYVYVARVLEKAGMLTGGRRGLGFAVGKEPLPLLFAEQRCEILMTDFPQGERWKKLVATKGIEHPKISYRVVDMKNIPKNLHGQWDFLWSCCAFEHLGDSKAGLKFVVDAMKCLRPGGIAVHTTEFNISSNTRTNDNCGSVLYRRCDIENLRLRLEKAGCKMAQIDWFSGDEPADWDIGHLDNERGYLKRLVIPVGHKQIRIRTTQNHRRIAAPIGFIGTSLGLYAYSC